MVAMNRGACSVSSFDALSPVKGWVEKNTLGDAVYLLNNEASPALFPKGAMLSFRTQDGKGAACYMERSTRRETTRGMHD